MSRHTHRYRACLLAAVHEIAVLAALFSPACSALLQASSPMSIRRVVSRPPTMSAADPKQSTERCAAAPCVLWSLQNQIWPTLALRPHTQTTTPAASADDGDSDAIRSMACGARVLEVQSLHLASACSTPTPLRQSTVMANASVHALLELVEVAAGQAADSLCEGAATNSGAGSGLPQAALRMADRSSFFDLMPLMLPDAVVAWLSATIHHTVTPLPGVSSNPGDAAALTREFLYWVQRSHTALEATRRAASASTVDMLVTTPRLPTASSERSDGHEGMAAPCPLPGYAPAHYVSVTSPELTWCGLIQLMQSGLELTTGLTHPAAVTQGHYPGHEHSSSTSSARGPHPLAAYLNRFANTFWVDSSLGVLDTASDGGRPRSADTTRASKAVLWPRAGDLKRLILGSSGGGSGETGRQFGLLDLVRSLTHQRVASVILNSITSDLRCGMLFSALLGRARTMDGSNLFTAVYAGGLSPSLLATGDASFLGGTAGSLDQARSGRDAEGVTDALIALLRGTPASAASGGGRPTGHHHTARSASAAGHDWFVALAAQAEKLPSRDIVRISAKALLARLISACALLTAAPLVIGALSRTTAPDAHPNPVPGAPPSEAKIYAAIMVKTQEVLYKQRMVRSPPHRHMPPITPARSTQPATITRPRPHGPTLHIYIVTAISSAITAKPLLTYCYPLSCRAHAAAGSVSHPHRRAAWRSQRCGLLRPVSLLGAGCRVPAFPVRARLRK